MAELWQDRGRRSRLRDAAPQLSHRTIFLRTCEMPPPGVKIPASRAPPWSPQKIVGVQRPIPLTGLPGLAIALFGLDFVKGRVYNGRMGVVEAEGFHELPGLLGAGVYMLCWNVEVLYVGKALRVYERVYSHRNAWERFRRGDKMPRRIKAILFNRVLIRPCHESDLDRIEREMIQLHQPKHNTLLLKTKPKLTLAEAGFDIAMFIPKGAEVRRA